MSSGGQRVYAKCAGARYALCSAICTYIILVPFINIPCLIPSCNVCSPR